jgi:hypothetical protein
LLNLKWRDAIEPRVVCEVPIYEDLSPYEYVPSDVPMTNVGWLGAAEPIPVGVIPERASDELLHIASEGVAENMMRGVQDCEFCEIQSPLRMPTPFNERGFASLGMGEFHVVGVDGRTFAAPTLVLHYINDHQYLPPQEFVDALLFSADRRESATSGERAT